MIFIFLTLAIYSLDNYLVNLFGAIIIIFNEKELLDMNDWLIIASFLGLKLIIIFSTQNLEFYKSIIFQQISIMINGLIFEKMRKLSPYSKALETGSIINLCRNDSTKSAVFINLLTQIVTLPISLGISIYALVTYDLVTGLVILSISCVLICFNFYLGIQFGEINYRLLKKKDVRMKATNNTFSDIVNLKMLEWDEEFLKRVID